MRRLRLGMADIKRICRELAGTGYATGLRGSRLFRLSAGAARGLGSTLTAATASLCAPRVPKRGKKKNASQGWPAEAFVSKLLDPPLPHVDKRRIQIQFSRYLVTVNFAVAVLVSEPETPVMVTT